MKPFQVRAPGRVCLFGEHSDYLGLNVIPTAISLAVEFKVNPRDDRKIRIEYSDLGQFDNFEIGEELEYRNSRDYVRSIFNILGRNGIIPNEGANIHVSGDIPLAAGLSSSSAFSIAGVLAVAQMAETKFTINEVVQLAFEAEVLEFGESGGMMDHFASAYGGIIHVDFGEEIRVTQLPAKLDGLVVGDSMEKQETVSDLRRIRTTVEEGYTILKRRIPDFDNRTTSVDEVTKHINELPNHCKSMTLATLKNRDLTEQALHVLEDKYPDKKELGRLLDEHHLILREGLERSTPKIERLISAAKMAGALGCKAIGSGGGGTMLSYAPGFEDEVSEAIKAAGGRPHRVKTTQGASVKFPN
jgi:galactokinase